MLTQGIGLRPQPWAGLSRPVGPGFWRSYPALAAAEDVRDKSGDRALSFSRISAYPVPHLRLLARFSSRRSACPFVAKGWPPRTLLNVSKGV